MHRQRFPALAVAVCLLALLCACGSGEAGDRGAGPENLQRYARLEVYTAQGRELLAVIEDEQLLAQYVQSFTAGAGQAGAANEDDIERKESIRMALAEYEPEYLIVSYKTPAALLTDGTLDKISEITLYSGTNLVCEQIAPETVKSFAVPPELLRIYRELDENDAAFLRSLAQTP